MCSLRRVAIPASAFPWLAVGGTRLISLPTTCRHGLCFFLGDDDFLSHIKGVELVLLNRSSPLITQTQDREIARSGQPRKENSQGACRGEHMSCLL